MVLVTLLAAWAFVAASLIGFNPADPPTHLVWPANEPVANWCGPFGAVIAYQLLKVLGMGAWVLVGFFGLGVLSAAAGGGLRHPAVRAIGLLMMTAAASGLQHLAFPKSGPLTDLPGGLVGTVGVAELSLRFGSLGTFLWLAMLGLIGAIVAMDEWLSAALGWTWRWALKKGVPAAMVAGKATGGLAGEAAVAVAGVAARGTVRAGGGVLAALGSMFRGKDPVSIRINDVDDDATLPVEEVKPKRRVRVPAEPQTIVEAVTGQTEDGEEERATDEGPTPTEPVTGPEVLDKEALRAKIAKIPLVFGAANKQIATEADLKGLQSADVEAEDTHPGRVYQFPGLDLLENPEENFNLKLEEYVREQATALEAALKQYRIDGEVVGIESGPVITLYDVRLAPGTKVAQVNAVSSDIARSLKAVNIRVVANMAGRDTVGVEVPNAQKEKVRLKELMSNAEKFAGMKLPMFLGKDASGEPLIGDLTQMPHMLIAGTTGSGKSVCINTIIMSLLYTKKPSELKLILVDPKMVELSQFKEIPHLMCPVVTEMGKAAAILEWATTKMDERYELLAEAGCRDIAAYNELPWEELKDRVRPKTPEEEARIPRKLPYMVYVIDELADLMMTAKEAESHIIRIAQKARAVGIHLILATQRPQANVVTGLIKSNMPCRISFKVASGMDSRIVLDQKGGELLLGHGDMLFLSPRSNKLTRAQGTLVDDNEIRRVVRFMRDIASPSFERQLMVLRRTGDDGSGLGSLTDEERLAASQNNSSASLAAAQEDPLFPRAVEIVLETKRGSVSLLQRRLAIGYTRASRLIDLMGIAGIISDHKGSVARDVLITEAEWEAMKQLAAEAGIGTGESQGSLFTEGVEAAACEPDGAGEPAPFEDAGAEGDPVPEQTEPTAARAVPADPPPLRRSA